MKAKLKQKQVEETVEIPVVSHLPLELIVDFPDMGNRQLDKEWVEELCASITANGLDTPLFVWDGGEEADTMEVGGKEYRSSFLVAGLHRRAALKKFRKLDPTGFAEKFPNGIPVRVFTGSLQDMLFLQLRENVNRQNPTVEDLLPKVLRLRDEFKLKNKVIAKKIGRSEAYVSNLLAIQEELGEEGVSEIIAGNVDAKDAFKAVQDLKKAKKSGKETAESKKDAITKAKDKTAKRREAGRARDERKVSFKKLWEIYKALPTSTDAENLKNLEGMCGYVAGDRDTYPKVFKTEAVKKSKAEAEEKDDE